MILGQEEDGKIWPIEMQFLLQSVADAKTALHFFQDLTRADFSAMQANFYERLITNIKEKGSKQSQNNSAFFVLKQQFLKL